MRRKRFQIVFMDTIPVLTGYLFLGMGFGILLSKSGYGLGWAFCMSLFMYAGSGQYLAVELLAAGSSLLNVAVATLLVNARHLFYGLSLLEDYKDLGKKKVYPIFALTDETYSLVTQNRTPQGYTRAQYCFLVSVLDHIYWIVGCLLGSVAGSLLPVNFEGVEFVLTALFVTMLVEQWLSAHDHRPALIGIGVTAGCLALFGRELFLIPSMVLIAVLLTVLPKTGRRAEHA